MAKVVKKSSKAKKTSSKVSKTKKSPTYNSKITRVLIGVVLALIFLMLTIACVSYLFTGADDQNVQSGERYGNILGAVGYAISHVVMNRMGLSTFFIMAIGFAVSGIIILDKPFSKIAIFISKMLLCALWIGVAAAYFSNSVYSGKWGFNLHNILYDKIGWGLAIVLLAFPLAWIIVRFSITPDKINQWREQRAEKKQLRKDALSEEEARREAENIALEKMAEAEDNSSPFATGEVAEEPDVEVVEVPDYTADSNEEKAMQKVDENTEEKSEPCADVATAFDIVDHFPIDSILFLLILLFSFLTSLHFAS